MPYEVVHHEIKADSASPYIRYLGDPSRAPLAPEAAYSHRPLAATRGHLVMRDGAELHKVDGDHGPKDGDAIAGGEGLPARGSCCAWVESGNLGSHPCQFSDACSSRNSAYEYYTDGQRKAISRVRP
ncbi:uncharacterized protein TRIREDRAFT_106229, partial [Trichoderma reesei QM6a]